MAEQKEASPVDIRSAVRNCYLLIIANSIWLLIPDLGLVSGNNLHKIIYLLAVGGAALFVTNTYIARKIYYLAAAAKDSIYESHLRNIDNIGFIVFFVTLISGLSFLLIEIFILNVFKSQFGNVLFTIVDVTLSALLTLLVVWILKHAISGWSQISRSQGYTYQKIANIF